MQGVWGALNPKYTERGAVLESACSQQQWKAKRRGRQDELSLFFRICSSFKKVFIPVWLTWLLSRLLLWVAIPSDFWRFSIAISSWGKVGACKTWNGGREGKKTEGVECWGGVTERGKRHTKKEKGNQSVSCSRTLSISITVCQCLQPHSLWVDKKHANVRNSEGYATLPVSASYMLMSCTHRAWGQATLKHMRQTL